jgi:hypothetical protein
MVAGAINLSFFNFPISLVAVEALDHVARQIHFDLFAVGRSRSDRVHGLAARIHVRRE